ncbi:MAG: hypothetical protein KA226_06415 [Gemmatimonadales bacterium]|jgi:hypothetical protein|nr:hypothetical protein [Gemmatimonadales bacterium]
MRSRILMSVVGMTLLALPLTAQADFFIAGRAGSLGLGIEVAKLITPNIGIRGGAYRFSHTISRSQSDVDFDADLKFKGMTGLVDLYLSPRGSFHFTGGIMSTPAEIDATGKPTGGTYTFDGTDYTAAQVGTVTGTGRWPKTMPYAGLGWGTPASKKGGITMLLDLGVGIGKPTVGLSASAATPGSALAQDIEDERLKIQADVDKYLKVYPVISLGLAIRF